MPVFILTSGIYHVFFNNASTSYALSEPVDKVLSYAFKIAGDYSSPNLKKKKLCFEIIRTFLRKEVGEPGCTTGRLRKVAD